MTKHHIVLIRNRMFPQGTCKYWCFLARQKCVYELTSKWFETEPGYGSTYPFKINCMCSHETYLVFSMEQSWCAVPSFRSLEHSGNLSMKSMFVRFLLTFSRVCCECRRCPVCWLMTYDIYLIIRHYLFSNMPSVWSLEHYGNLSMNPFTAYGFKNLFWMSKATFFLTHDIWHIRLIIITVSQTCDDDANTETNTHSTRSSES